MKVIFSTKEFQFNTSNLFLLGIIISTLIHVTWANSEAAAEETSTGEGSTSGAEEETVWATLVPYRQDNCLYCLNDSPGYNYCNH